MKGDGSALTAVQIELGKAATSYSLSGARHEHDDCIRLAFEWLDAQKRVQKPVRRSLALKHMIEAWAGRYVSMSDVEVAATLHPDIIGVYPFYNISARLTYPSSERLSGIGEALRHDKDRERYRDGYSVSEA